jgi:small-conductance mechanosensitive channel
MRRLLLALSTLILLWPSTLAAQAAPPGPAAPTPAQLQALADLLRDPAIQSWLAAQVPSAAPTTTAEPALPTGSEATQAMLSGRLEAIRGFLRQTAAELPLLPSELARAWLILSLEFEERGVGQLLLYVLAFVALGSGVEWLFHRITAGARQRIVAAPVGTARERLHAAGLRLGYGIGMVTAFALGSVGAFLIFDWPLLLKEIVLSYLMVVVVVRLVLVLTRLVLAPGAERFRMVPMATPTAWYWTIWSAVLVGWFAIVNVTLPLLATLGVSETGWYTVGLICGIVLLVLALVAVWQQPSRTGEPGMAPSRLKRILISLYLIGTWLLLLTGSIAPFYVAIVLLLLPIAIRGAHLAVGHVLRQDEGEPGEGAVPSVMAVAIERGLRAALLIGAAFLIASILDLDLGALTSRETLATRLARSAINVAIIALLADLVWQMARAWIDYRLDEASAAGQLSSDEARRRQRLRTLLPILRNVLFVVLLVMAALMALSAMGVEVGPLIAGAGVVGVAVGFGAQSLVKDIIAGMFFLLDDAFRVGEYIESGGTRGTVEAFSLRSVKLRHHRGALHTVPFGSLEKITNYSRDWVIDKLTLNVTFDADLDKAKRLIKQIGRELAGDPEHAPHIIEPLKMQGVDQFGDFAIQIRLKMMTRPGEQFVIRRKAYAMIKKAFDANGIRLAVPTVAVAGGAEGEGVSAVAQKAVEMAQPAVP